MDDVQSTLEKPLLQETMSKYWHLEVEQGRQRWIFKENYFKDDFPNTDIDQELIDQLFSSYGFNKEKNPNSSDLIYRQIKEDPSFEDSEIPSWLKEATNFCHSLEKAASQSAFKGINYYRQLQSKDGHWPGDYGGPMFLLPGLIIASHLTASSFGEMKSQLMIRYMLNHQNKDGGWGLHIEGESTMFGSVMQYCALRILGVPATSNQLVSARKWILENGGATGIPSWGKFFLALLGVYEWKGCNSLMPEMWLLPKALPFHPWRYWCHARMVYLPMSYCYGHRVTAPPTQLIEDLKRELYLEDYENISWSKARFDVAETDSFFKTPTMLKRLLKVINIYEQFNLPFLRNKALKFVLKYVEAEDQQTNSIDIGPVNQIINSICVWHAYGKESRQFKAHHDRWDDYLWLAEDGMKMNGYNGSQLWDTAFATQAILENPSELVDSDTITKAYEYIESSQIKTEVEDREKFFRHPSVSGWPFSTIDHGWPIADCTAEGLKAALSVHNSEFAHDLQGTIPQERLEQAVDLILSFQNRGGGWATYELQRSGASLELLNPSEVFGKIMVDYPWVECTSACLSALMSFIKTYPDYRQSEIQDAIRNGIDFLLKEQRNDGSWIGSWGVCFTYGTWFGLEALTQFRNSNLTIERIDQAIGKATAFLVSHQNADGGWGESHKSCVHSEYVAHETSQIVNTSWALLGLMAANYQDKSVINRGIAYLIEQQMGNGDWPQQGISGVFNQNCMITYTAYRNVFPIWAVGRYLNNCSKALNYRGNSTN